MGQVQVGEVMWDWNLMGRVDGFCDDVVGIKNRVHFLFYNEVYNI